MICPSGHVCFNRCVFCCWDKCSEHVWKCFLCVPESSADPCFVYLSCVWKVFPCWSFTAVYFSLWFCQYFLYVFSCHYVDCNHIYSQWVLLMSCLFYYYVQESPFHKGCFLRSSVDAWHADSPEFHVYWTLWCHDHWSCTWESHWLNMGGAYSTDMLYERVTCNAGWVGIGFHPASHSMAFDRKCIYLITLYNSGGSSTLLYSLFFMNSIFFIFYVFQLLYGYCKAYIKHLNCYKLETIYILSLLYYHGVPSWLALRTPLIALWTSFVCKKLQFAHCFWNCLFIFDSREIKYNVY